MVHVKIYILHVTDTIKPSHDSRGMINPEHDSRISEFIKKHVNRITDYLNFNLISKHNSKTDGLVQYK